MCLVNLAFFNLEKFEDTQKNPTPCPTPLLPHRKWQDMTTTQSPIQKENISIASYLPHIVFLGCAFLSSPPSIPGWPSQTITSISLAKYWLCHWLLEIIFWLQTVTVRHSCFRKTSTDIWSISPVVTCETSSLRCVSVVQFSPSVCLTLCDPMVYSTPGFPVHHHLPKLAQTHVHRVGDAIQPSHPMSSPSPAFNLSQHQGLVQWVHSSHQVAKVLEFQLQHQSFQWTFRTDFL